VCDRKEKNVFFSFVVARTLEEPLPCIPSANDGCNDKNEEHLDNSNSLSNIGIKMNDISLIPSLLFHFFQENLTLVSSQYIFVFVSNYFSKFSLGFFLYIQTKLF
jgi:hypothetical protein